ncbi:hypothetical protein ABVT39_027863 [Epinephelus coioides]
MSVASQLKPSASQRLPQQGDDREEEEQVGLERSWRQIRQAGYISETQMSPPAFKDTGCSSGSRTRTPVSSCAFLVPFKIKEDGRDGTRQTGRFRKRAAAACQPSSVDDYRPWRTQNHSR